jgi:hypothetical protein
MKSPGISLNIIPIISKLYILHAPCRFIAFRHTSVVGIVTLTRSLRAQTHGYCNIAGFIHVQISARTPHILTAAFLCLSSVAPRKYLDTTSE